MNTIAVAAVQLSRFEVSIGSVTQTKTTIIQCWRFGIADENTMRGIAVEKALESKPGFSIDQVLVNIIDVDENKGLDKGSIIESLEKRIKELESENERLDAQVLAERQHTCCAVCGKDKHTPLRRDEMGGFVFMTFIHKRLDYLEDFRKIVEKYLEKA